MTGRRPTKRLEEERGEEERKEVASKSVENEEEAEEDEQRQGKTKMPAIQIKPEPEEMECTVRRGRRKEVIGWLVRRGKGAVGEEAVGLIYTWRDVWAGVASTSESKLDLNFKGDTELNL